MFRAIFNRTLRSKVPISKTPGEFKRHVTSENKILESPQWNNKVDFTLKESVLHDIDKRRTEAIENRITKAENKIIFALVGCTVSIITSFISLNSTSNKKETDKKIVYVKIRD
ncbi:14557_t:CDS:2 [Funneliformis caledonium]|uniref:14557_t:CDS:1 n=1 Tax=Funneliformis caledonium TaxID=1117310 RepID=A0A9N8WPI2_9GLOM|nr:14557_t:CDS:2 [Funneliformis caledonium]